MKCPAHFLPPLQPRTAPSSHPAPVRPHTQPNYMLRMPSWHADTHDGHMLGTAIPYCSCRRATTSPWGHPLAWPAGLRPSRLAAQRTRCPNQGPCPPFSPVALKPVTTNKYNTHVHTYNTTEACTHIQYHRGAMSCVTASTFLLHERVGHCQPPHTWQAQQAGTDLYTTYQLLRWKPSTCSSSSVCTTTLCTNTPTWLSGETSPGQQPRQGCSSRVDTTRHALSSGNNFTFPRCIRTDTVCTCTQASNSCRRFSGDVAS